jgi:hypothetical protein
MNVLQLVANKSFITVNKVIAQRFGLDAAVLLGELASTQVYWEEQGGLDGEGMFYQTCEQITQNTTLSKHQQAKAAKVLEDAGVLKTKKKGLPPMKYYVIDADELWVMLNQRRLKNLTNDGEKIEPTSVKKFNTNNKRENNKREIIKDKKDIVFNSTLSEPVREKLIEYLEYRDEMKKPFKSERGIKTLVGQVEKQEQMHGAMAVIGVIDKTMSNGWQGLFWDKIETPSSKVDMIDQWAANAERRSNAESDYL